MGRIQNPLHGIPRAQLLAQVEEFAKEKEMADKIDLLRKAALLAQNPKEFEQIPELDEEDRAVIRQEITRMLRFKPPLRLPSFDTKLLLTDRWHQPFALYMTVVVCSLAAAVQ